jgi:hypothetical protein
MNSNSRLTLLLLLAGVLLSISARTIKGQQFPQAAPAWDDEVPCRKDPLKRVDQTFANNYVALCLDYDEKQLQPNPKGDPHDVNLTITSYTARGGKNPVVKNIELRDSAGQLGLHFGGIKEQPQGNVPFKEHSSSRTFLSQINITREATPREYHVKLTLVLNLESKTVEFDLPVVTQGDWLELKLTKPQVPSISCWTGSDCDNLKLKMTNKLPWNVTIVSVGTADSDDLVEVRVLNPDQKKIANDYSVHDLDLTIHAKDISWTRVFAGFSKAPQFQALIKYEDDYGRRFEQPVDVDLQIRPNLFILTLTVLLGVAFGTIIRVDLLKLEKAGYIKRKQTIIFACTTIGAGILVSIIALLANLKLVVFENQSTYSSWDPKVLFFTGLVGTIGGIPLLYARLKLPQVAVPTPSPLGTTGEHSMPKGE